MNATAPVLEADAISLGYLQPGRTYQEILRDFSLTVSAGEVLVLLGPSGVGKSSLLRVLAGLQPARRGTVRLFGEALRSPHPRVAFMFQDACLLPWLDVRRNVAFGLGFKRQPRLDPELRHQRVDAALDEVGLTRAAGVYPDQLSGGMAQRVSLARALVRQPRVLLLDEPFSALDEVTRSDMQQLLLAVTRRHHTAVVMVTHDIDEALTLADRVLLVGGQPGHLLRDWPLALPHPRDETAVELIAMRAQIVHTLRSTRTSQAAAV